MKLSRKFPVDAQRSPAEWRRYVWFIYRTYKDRIENWRNCRKFYIHRCCVHFIRAKSRKKRSIPIILCLLDRIEVQEMFLNFIRNRFQKI
ncbi:hypothetical protein LEP1GSC012_0728 [Leptospira interrogans serovar Valbuzzi str. Valbuzzi]|nr:hypothetical protein LEP1GSC012_0728 [Leptospira interrogans serovar Valbuzzi str. Valbuzzi]